MSVSKIMFPLIAAVAVYGVCGASVHADDFSSKLIVGQGSQLPSAGQELSMLDQGAPKFTVLPDRFNVLKGSLTNSSDIHYYGFNVLRGQQVLAKGYFPSFILFEIHDGTKWTSIDADIDWALRSPKIGQDVIARFSHRKDMPFVEGAEYGLHLGSFPQVTRTRLKDQPVGMARIPPEASF